MYLERAGLRRWRLCGLLVFPGRADDAGLALVLEAIEEIKLIPKDGRLLIELVGTLASILALGNGERPRPFGQGRQLKLVAGAGFEPATFRL